MDYNHYDVDDFVADAFFKRWVKQPDEATHIFWEKWLEERPEKADTIAQAKSMVAFLNFSVEEASPEEQQEVKANIMRQIRSRQHVVHPNPFRRYLSVAAVACLLLTGAYFVWQFALDQPYHQYATDFGAQKEILLPDSTLVKLNANSSLKFRKDWSDQRMREVWLEGEAFFEVVKKPDAADGRFFVHTNQLDVEVLGTTFNVQARHGETQVVLNTGKIKLHQASQGKEQQEIFLEPGEMATLSKDALVKSQVNPHVYSSWKDNRLFFENESIRKIARRLNDTYGYEVKVARQEWLDLTFTGSCPADDISILLTAISESFEVQVTLHDQQIHIQPYE